MGKKMIPLSDTQSARKISQRRGASRICRIISGREIWRPGFLNGFFFFLLLYKLCDKKYIKNKIIFVKTFLVFLEFRAGLHDKYVITNSVYKKNSNNAGFNNGHRIAMRTVSLELNVVNGFADLWPRTNNLL